MAPSIRRARAGDDHALRALDAATWSWDSSPAPLGPPGRPFFAPHRDPEDVLVAVVGGAVAGYVRLEPATPLESNRHVLEITGLAVAPSARRRGVGRRLLAAATQEAAARGTSRLRLRVLAPNDAARRLYESCGFVLEGVLRGEFRIQGRDVDDLLMALSVGDSHAPGRRRSGAARTGERP